MKILLREYNGIPYVWMTAKYDEDHFIINGERVEETRIVSIMNDNRKNYIRCSCCGKVFKKGSHKFQIHKENASSPQTCLNCPALKGENERVVASKYTMDEDGNARQILERSVRLVCGRYGYWSHSDINSDEAIECCRKRQCANATEMEITDFFTEYPGAFDEIITSDNLLDIGCHFTLKPNGGREVNFVSEEDYAISAYANRYGIIDRFYIWYEGEDYSVWYSKKYHELYWDCGNYEVFYLEEMDESTREEIKNHIAKLYR